MRNKSRKKWISFWIFLRSGVKKFHEKKGKKDSNRIATSFKHKIYSETNSWQISTQKINKFHLRSDCIASHLASLTSNQLAHLSHSTICRAMRSALVFYEKERKKKYWFITRLFLILARIRFQTFYYSLRIVFHLVRWRHSYSCWLLLLLVVVPACHRYLRYYSLCTMWVSGFFSLLLLLSLISHFISAQLFPSRRFAAEFAFMALHSESWSFVEYFWFDEFLFGQFICLAWKKCFAASKNQFKAMRQHIIKITINALINGTPLSGHHVDVPTCHACVFHIRRSILSLYVLLYGYFFHSLHLSSALFCALRAD